jgi:Tfp pilus assembly protein FimT
MLCRRERGYTLVELLIIVILVGIIAAVVGPKLAWALRQRAVAGAADEFVLAHSLARSTAMQYGRVAQLHVDTAGARFWVDADTSGTGTPVKIGLMHSLAGGSVTLSSTRTLFCFDARGLATTSGGCPSGDATVVFASSSSSDTVRTTVLGKVLR